MIVIETTCTPVWPAPVRIRIGTGFSKQIHGPAEALSHLDNCWPNTDGSGQEAARLSCIRMLGRRGVATKRETHLLRLLWKQTCWCFDWLTRSAYAFVLKAAKSGKCLRCRCTAATPGSAFQATFVFAFKFALARAMDDRASSVADSSAKVFSNSLAAPFIPS